MDILLANSLSAEPTARGELQTVLDLTTRIIIMINFNCITIYY